MPLPRLFNLRLLSALLVTTLAILWSGDARAQTCSATITDMDFGAPSTLSTTPNDAIGTITVTCTRIPLFTTVKMCPSLGEGSGGASGSARLMRGPGNAVLAYQLYQDASRTQAWGAVDNNQLGNVPVLTIGSGFSSSATVTARLYGRLFGSQTVAPPGSYLSAFIGAETVFTYSPILIGFNVGCAGFIGSAVLHPEFEVLARPPSGCSVTTTDLNFPATGLLRNTLAAEASIRVTCTSATSYSVSLDNGTSGTGPTARRMVSAAGAGITYGLYRDNGRTMPWGTAAGGQAVNGAGTGTVQILPVYGSVPAQPTPAPGLYSDRIVVTLTY